MKALLIIDVDNETIAAYNPSIVDAINKAIVTFEGPIIYVKNIFKLRCGIKHHSLANDLMVVSDYIFEKEHASAFTNRELGELIASLKIKEITIVGVDGNHCVKATAEDAVKMGIVTNIVTSLIDAKNKELFKTTQANLSKLGIIFK